MKDASFLSSASATAPRRWRAGCGAGWRIAATCRSREKQDELRARGIEAHPSSMARRPLGRMAIAALAGTTHLLSSVPPDDGGRSRAGLPWRRHRSSRDPALGRAISRPPGVYGDRGGGWVDETQRAQAQRRARPAPGRSRSRLARPLARDRRPAGACLPPRRHLRAGTLGVRQPARGPRAAHRQAGPGLQPHPCRRHRRSACAPPWRGPIRVRSTMSATTIPRRRPT